MREALDLALRLNLAAAAAILTVMLLRWPARRLFGPRIAYGLWALVPLAVAALLVPTRVVTVPARPSPDIAPMTDWTAAPAAAPAIHAPASLQAPFGLDDRWLAGLWLLGLSVALIALWRSQARFQSAAREGRAGPAVVGVIAPRIVTPDDFASLYTPRERDVVLAHEATHIARQDSRINALVALARCVAWFNPMVHLMARWMRIDQEFACDAAVVARYPRARRVYAQALLKAQMAARPLPFGCHWSMTHPLVARVDFLARPRGDVMARAAGAVAVAVLVFGGASALWAARPARLVSAPSHEAVILARAVRNAPPWPAPVAPPRSTTTAERLTPVPLTEAPTPATVVPVAFQAASVSEAMPQDPPQRAEKIRGAAEWSSVAPGSAVRVIANMIDWQGKQLVTDLTAFGSQSLYRTGYFERGGSRLKLFTAVVQHGDRYRVTAALNGRFWPEETGSVDLAAGESGIIRMPQGLEVSIHLAARPETPEETAAARALGPRRFVSIERIEPWI